MMNDESINVTILNKVQTQTLNTFKRIINISRFSFLST